ncbi:MAG: putative OB-fold protein, partial [Bacteroidia bacterium]
ESCPTCKGALSWRTLSGSATLLSWTTVRRQINGSFDVPYTPAIVIPDDAPSVQLVTQLFFDEGQEPYCDMPLMVAFEELKPLQTKAFIAPVFTALEQQ